MTVLAGKALLGNVDDEPFRTGMASGTNRLSIVITSTTSHDLAILTPSLQASDCDPRGRSSELQKKIESITRRMGEAEKPCGVEFFESLVHRDRVINGDTVIH
ncbi:hypothetical protein CDAR_373681 [Caerostris darwini]|uniref:Uncharacterized protein n=1 Tax=Caerostris darwini TaxID=1538125 RepID=A0AAV4QKQ0_9ARAC|nr:hypothetical protein CDAR_373681 [Caerostris darwini]